MRQVKNAIIFAFYIVFFFLCQRGMAAECRDQTTWDGVCKRWCTRDDDDPRDILRAQMQCAKTCDWCGIWTEWTDLNTCNHKDQCGLADKNQSRICTPGTGRCPGLAKRELMCRDTRCPSPIAIQGGWSHWGAWSPCSEICEAVGEREKKRTCTNPAPKFGGWDCILFGPSLITGRCYNEKCPGWTEWGSYSACSKQCGSGVKERIRNCTAPAHAQARFCQGEGVEKTNCFLKSCYIPVHGGWGRWLPVGNCTKTCGNGHQMFTRECNNPAPLNKGKPCAGPTAELRPCMIRECGISYWATWSNWRRCSSECDIGISTRTRTCHQINQQHCLGSAHASKICHSKCDTDSIHSLFVDMEYSHGVDKYINDHVDSSRLMTSLALASIPLLLYVALLIWKYFDHIRRLRKYSLIKK